MNEFLTPLNWFYTKYYGKDPQRFWSEQAALNLFVQRNGKVIVETGTIREADGESTLILGEFAYKNGARLITVDNDPEKIEYSKKVTKEFSSNITYVLSDSVEFLKNFDSRIDLLYLDSLDFPLFPEREEYDEEVNRAQLHNLEEVKVSENKFTDKTILLIDDFDFPRGGKAGLSNEYLSSRGWEAIIASKQILWIQSLNK